MSGQKHKDHRQQIGHSSEEASSPNADCGSRANDGWQPKYKPIDADAPAKVENAKHQHISASKCFTQAGDAGQSELFSGELSLNFGSALHVYPRGVTRLIPHKSQPQKCPENRRYAFNDEGLLPAESLDQVSGYDGHPEHGDGIAEHKEGVSARTLRAREPVSDKHEHRRKDDALGDSEQETVKREQPELENNAGERGKRSPQKKRDEDNAGATVSPGICHSRHLKSKIAEEEKRTEKRGLRARDVQCRGETCGSSQAIVGAVEVREAVGDECSGQHVKPTLAAIAIADNDLLFSTGCGAVFPWPCHLQTQASLEVAGCCGKGESQSVRFSLLQLRGSPDRTYSPAYQS